MTFFIDRPETDKFWSKLAEGLQDPANNPLVFNFLLASAVVEL
jgi:hypothetical protein